MHKIINFAIIAHIDHGKSTLADRLLELTGVVESGKHAAQLLDANPISRERGITIKLAPVRMNYPLRGETITLNLVDTPGHVDFSYEVERTLACVEGAVLLVDGTQGVQAQTIAHLMKAIELGVHIIPAINKIDSPLCKTEETIAEIIDLLSCSAEDIMLISAKTGQGVRELLERVIDCVPPANKSLYASGDKRALIFDSYYDTYQGVIAFVRVFGGEFRVGNSLYLASTGEKFATSEIGLFHPQLVKSESLSMGEVGYIVTGLKDISAVRVGDTITDNTDTSPLPGYKTSTPMVFSSLFPTESGDFLRLKAALEKLVLNDASVSYEAIYSASLGSGFRVGFLGLLHADVVRERLEREFDLSLVLTSPTVNFQIYPDHIEEPIASVLIVTPPEHLSAVIKLLDSSRGQYLHIHNSHSHVHLSYLVPLAELMGGFFDKLKNHTSGYATLQWELKNYTPVEASRLEIIINDEVVEEFSEYVVAMRAPYRAREIVDRLKDLIPKQQYEVRIQARFSGRIIASSRISALRKDVTAKLYGGDRTRKDKLLNKQKEGKKLMKQIGRVEVPKEVFRKLFSSES